MSRVHHQVVQARDPQPCLHRWGRCGEASRGLGNRHFPSLQSFVDLSALTTTETDDHDDAHSLGRSRIAWIAALPIERAAAAALLDELHDEPHGFSQHPADENAYTWGRMGKHNIVIASLAAGLYGTTSAATTASKLLSSLPQIRIGLLVGVGGGIPRPGEGRDIRLGDIVVSQPDGATGGVVQYDLLKSKPNNRHERKDFLNMPPPVLLHALGKLRAEHEFEEPMVSKSLSKMLGDKPRMAKSRPGYVHQGFENDRLFPASYEHAGALDCRSCDPDKQVQRDMRDSTDPEIHYGIIASGNTLVKDAVERDKVVEHIGEDCFCVEMEAPGLMNHFPCLVIRGICDYADSHKDHRWQRYASATAAAFAKELLSYVPRHEASKRRRGLSSFSGLVSRPLPLIRCSLIAM